MPSTTNFGWTTPADTDLVKDGAAAIRTLGNGVDASFVDLKGGTTGQILSKNSNTDLDFTWIANDQGDITAVTAGTGISGGGTSGAVTITNSMATEITASGDIIVGTGSGTFDNLPIGTTGQVLTADTTVSPYKVKWATVGGAAFSGCYASNTTNQTIADQTWTTVTWNNKIYDTDSYHSTSSNTGRFTIPSGKSGYYQVIFNWVFAANASNYRDCRIRKNGAGGAIAQQYGITSNVATPGQPSLVRIIYLAAGDYIEAQVVQGSGGNLNLLCDAQDEGYITSFLINYLGA